MINFSQLPLFGKNIFILISFLLMIVLTWIFVVAIRHEYEIVIASSVVLATIVMFCLQCMIATLQGNITPTASMFFKISILQLSLLYFLIISVIVYYFILLLKWSNGNLSLYSIKDATDEIPTGLLYYYSDGRIKLSNKAINQICFSMTRKILVDGLMFTDDVLNGRISNDWTIVDFGGTSVYKHSEGKVYRFSLKRITVDNQKLNEVVMDDITELYNSNIELEKSVVSLTEMNHRMSELSNSIQKVTIEKEILNAKIRIHDDLGILLISSSQYLGGDSSVSKNDLVKAWNDNISFILNEEPEKIEINYDAIFNASRDVGVDIVLEGTLPESEIHKTIAISAIHECLTNTIRHAQGNKLYLTISEDSDIICIEITNSGNKPIETITESGGLKNLRAMVESNKGKMIVESSPIFKLIIQMKREK